MKELFDEAAILAELKQIAKEKDEELKRIKDRIGEKERVLAERMLEEDVQNFTHAGNMFYLNPKTHASVTADIMPDFIRRVRARKFGGIVKTTILPQTLTAFVKEQTEENGGQTPKWMEKFVNVYITTSIGIRKAK